MKDWGRHKMQVMSFIARSMILFVATLPFYAWAGEQAPDGFSDVEVKQISESRLHKGCLDLEAEFSGPLSQTPTAVLDAEQADGLEGVITQIMNVFSIGPTRYHLSIQDPEACKALRNSQKPVSITVEDGKALDGTHLFPYEKKIRLK